MRNVTRSIDTETGAVSYLQNLWGDLKLRDIEFDDLRQLRKRFQSRRIRRKPMARMFVHL
jgi:hypothetical protein